MKKKYILLMSLVFTLLFTSGVSASPFRYYTVKEGDSLYKLSKQFGVTVDYLINANNLNSSVIKAGSSLIIGQNDNAVKITVNNQPVNSSAGFIQDGRTLVPIRFVSEMLGAEVDWLPTEQCAVVIFNQKAFLFKSNSKNVYINGAYKSIDVPAKNINGRIYVPLRFIAENHNISVEWDGTSKTVHLINNKSSELTRKYTDEDVYWLARVIYSESEDQPLHGQLAVGAVVMNRVASPLFPNTVKDVIFQHKQFTPVMNGTIYKTPPAQYYSIAKMVLNGYNVDKNTLFFLNPVKSTSFWIVNNRNYIMTIGDHDFYR